MNKTQTHIKFWISHRGGVLFSVRERTENAVRLVPIDVVGIAVPLVRSVRTVLEAIATGRQLVAHQTVVAERLIRLTTVI